MCVTHAVVSQPCAVRNTHDSAPMGTDARTRRPCESSSSIQLVRFAIVMLTMFGCGRQSPLAPIQARPSGRTSALRQAEFVAGSAVHLEGQIGPGAIYAIDVPANWNGDLVLYAHGYTTPSFRHVAGGRLSPDPGSARSARVRRGRHQLLREWLRRG